MMMTVSFLCLVLCQTPFASVDQAVAEQMDKQKLVGVSIGIIRDGKIVYTRGYGLANRETKSPMTESTVINWASNSKPMAGVLAMQLVEQKKLNLDADIRKYVPEWPDQGDTITTRQLLCHQSGIPHYANGKIVPAKTSKPDSDNIGPIQSLDVFLNSPLIHKPGSKAEYSSYAYILLSAVIERAGGESYDSQIRKRVAEPLKLKSLTLDGDGKGQSNWAIGYVKKGERIDIAKDEANDWKFGAGGYKSNVVDFASWANALMGDSLMKAATKETMWTAQKLSNGNATTYGLGFVVESQNGLKISHNGSQSETTTRLVLYPKRRTGVVVMCNCQFATVGSISTAIFAAMESK